MYRYRLATTDDALAILSVLEEVAPEIPVETHDGRPERLLQTIKRTTSVYGVTWIALDRENRVVGFLLAESKGDRFDLPYGGVREGHRKHHIFPDLVAKMMVRGVPLTATVKHANKSDMASRLLRLGFTKAGPGYWPDEDAFRWQP
ncbi:MAG TPA: hypothetical protein VIE65_18820 [Methylobacter sp.]|jgi:hypothetical protein